MKICHFSCKKWHFPKSRFWGGPDPPDFRPGPGKGKMKKTRKSRVFINRNHWKKTRFLHFRGFLHKIRLQLLQTRKKNFVVCSDWKKGSKRAIFGHFRAFWPFLAILAKNRRFLPFRYFFT